MALQDPEDAPALEDGDQVVEVTDVTGVLPSALRDRIKDLFIVICAEIGDRYIQIEHDPDEQDGMPFTVFAELNPGQDEE